MRLLIPAALCALLAACASIGHPQGGPRDQVPPAFVRSTPPPGTRGFNGRQVQLYFDENIQLDDPTNKIIISPPPTRQPHISSNGHRINIEFRDSLELNSTYTIDFADAIRDLNEGNILDGFALDFSTGEMLDTLAISGMVFEARNLEPAQGMLVGLYPDSVFNDTTLTTSRFDRVTKTNALGQFTLRNLKPGSYRIFAVNDLNRDFRWDRSEDIAFLTEPVTVTANSLRADDVLLTWFNENYTPLYLTKNERPEQHRLSILFAAAADSMPSFRLLQPEGLLAGRTLVEYNQGYDTINVWLRDSVLIKADTIMIEARYRYTDSVENIVWKSDTLTFAWRAPRSSRSSEPSNAETTPLLAITTSVNGQHDLDKPVILTSPTPIERLDTALIRLEMEVDSAWVRVDLPAFVPTSALDCRNYVSKPQWVPGGKYRLTVDSLAVSDIYGLTNKELQQMFFVKEQEDYAALFVTVGGLTDSVMAVVELLRSDDVVRTAVVVNGIATFRFIDPGTYYLRLFIDTDGNGEWTKGHFATATLPEDVYYYPKKINLKKNWDMDLDWDINSLPVDEQKPQDILKNKPPRPKWEETPNRPLTDDEDEDDMMMPSRVGGQRRR